MNRRRSSIRAFTLIELLVVVAIVALLATLFTPAYKKMVGAADSARCANNLRQISTLILTAAQENNNRFPRIENDPTDPVHGGNEAGKIWTLPELVESQGGSRDVLKCPADIRNAGSQTGRNTSYFAWKGSSYEWLPFFEDESISSPTIRGPFGQFTVPLSRVRLLMDYAENGVGPHDRGVGTSAMNVVFADGSVRRVVLDGDNW